MVLARVPTAALPLALLLLGPAVAPAVASVVVAQSIESMAREARTVVRGTVRASSSAWDDAHRRIHTYSEVEVREVWAGGAPETLVVRTLGGVVGDVGQRVDGVARLSPGEDVVLFLRADPKDAELFSVIGLSQGKLRVEPRGDGPVAIPSHRGLVLARPGPDGRWTAEAASDPSSLPLEELRARVRAARVDGAAPSVPR